MAKVRVTAFTQRVVGVVRSIPRGRVMSYGGVAAAAGSPRAARGVVWILHSSSDAAGLPWHRVVGSGGKISLGPGRGGELQRAALESEGVEFGLGDTIDLTRFGYGAVRGTRGASRPRPAGRSERRP